MPALWPMPTPRLESKASTPIVGVDMDTIRDDGSSEVGILENQLNF